MSGGSMEYVFGRIYEASEQARNYARETEEKDVDEFAFDAKRANVPPADLKESVVGYMKTAVTAIRIAAIYAQRIEWLTSGDDGYDSFIRRTDEDLCNLSKELVDAGLPTGIILPNDAT